MQSGTKHRKSATVLCAAKVICQLGFPGIIKESNFKSKKKLNPKGQIEEKIRGIRKRYFQSGIIPELLYFGQQGEIRSYNIIKKEELTFGDEISKGLKFC